MFLVRDGRVAVIGGHYRYSDGQPVNSSEFVDVAAGTSALTGTFNVPRTTSGPGPTLMLANGQEAAMVERRGVAAAVVLRDGRVLVAGGTQTSGGFQPIIASTEIYSPATNSWQRASPMHEARALYTLTLLADGRVLAAGGASESFTRALCSAEIFDPATGTWTLTASMGSARQGTGAVRLPNGEVLIIGGYPGGLRTTEIFTPCE